MSTRKRKQIPAFTSDDEERSFWAAHDSNDYVDWRRATRPSFSDLKPSLRTISLRLPESMIGQLKLLAHKRDVPYQSLLKQFLAERLRKEIA
jgi:predicted DNA binding CopG/RHH family protein